MEDTFKAALGKGMPDVVKDPAIEELKKTLNNVSSRVSQADETATTNLIANLNTIPGACADEATIEAAQVSAIVEDHENIVDAMRLDAVEKMTDHLEGTRAWGAWTPLMARRRTAAMKRRCAGAPCRHHTLKPPSALVSLSGQRERANENATFHLQKARMAFIEAHASKPVWQTDIRVFPRPKEGAEGSAAELCCMVPVWCS